MTSDFPVPGTKLYISTLWCSIAQYALRGTPHTTLTTQLTWRSLYHTYLGFCPQAGISRSQDRLFLHLVKFVLQQRDTNWGKPKVISVKCKLQSCAILSQLVLYGGWNTLTRHSARSQNSYSLLCAPFRIPVIIILDRKQGITSWTVSKMLHVHSSSAWSYSDTTCVMFLHRIINRLGSRHRTVIASHAGAVGMHLPTYLLPTHRPTYLPTS
jgi:hypothetical protein